MPKTIKFHNTPALTREVVNNWLVHAKKQQGTEPGQIAILEDVLQLIDVAMDVLSPEPAAAEKTGTNKKS